MADIDNVVIGENHIKYYGEILVSRNDGIINTGHDSTNQIYKECE